MQVHKSMLFVVILLGSARHGNNKKNTGPKILDMSVSAVDDQFVECQSRMLKEMMASDGLLQKELRNNTDFSKVWDNTKISTPKPVKGGSTVHSQALLAYDDVKFRIMFNDAVESQGGNASVYLHSFPFKSLHFLLTDAMRLLQTKNCRSVFRGSETTYKTSVGSKVRFGRFTTAVIKKSDAEEHFQSFGTVFTIMSCNAVDIELYVHKNSDISWLIPPYEVFTVIDIEDTDDYQEITLKHQGIHSNHECSFFSDSSRSFAQVNSYSFLIFSLLLVSCLSVSLKL